MNAFIQISTPKSSASNGTYLAVMLLLLLIGSSRLSAQFYHVNFEGAGAVSTVDSVRVYNITQGTSLVMDGNDTLFLYGMVGNSLPGHRYSEKLDIYPNPSTGTIQAQFTSESAGNYIIVITNATGSLVGKMESWLHEGIYTIGIQGLGAGFYTLSIVSDSYHYTGKILSHGTRQNIVSIQLAYLSDPMTKSSLKSATQLVYMQYNHGDRLLFTAFADIYAVVTTLVANKDTTMVSQFVSCTDGDGNHYPVAYLGTQVWMASNLKTTKYNDGTNIPNVTVGSAWVNLTSGAYCWYGNNESNKTSYGALYNWYALDPEGSGNKNPCPTGWHAPTDAEWTVLTTFMGGNTQVGGKLKETGFLHWNSPNTGATNEVGFSARAGGSRIYNGNFSYMGTYCYYWTSSEQQGAFAWLRNMFHNASNIGRGNINKLNGFSVRCVMD